MLLLVVHGLAGVIWLPAAQVLIHQLVGQQELASAVRLNATGRYLGFLVGPLLGAGLLMSLGPAYGIFVNALIYTPLFLWLIRAPYGRAAPGGKPPAAAVGSFAEVWSTMRVVARNPVLLSMTVLVGAASFFVGNAYQAQMPEFASDLGHERADFAYSILLAADAAGGLIGGVILETRAWLAPRARTAFVLALIWCVALVGFRAREWLRAGRRPLVRGGIRRVGVQLDGAGPGPAARARRDTRPGDRRVLHVGVRIAHVQRAVRRPFGRARGHP